MLFVIVEGYSEIKKCFMNIDEKYCRKKMYLFYSF